MYGEIKCKKVLYFVNICSKWYTAIKYPCTQTWIGSLVPTALLHGSYFRAGYHSTTVLQPDSSIMSVLNVHTYVIVQQVDGDLS